MTTYLPHALKFSIHLSGPFRKIVCEFGPVRSGPFREVVDPPSLHLGYDVAVPDEARYNRLQQRNTRRVSTVECEDAETMETGNAM